MTRDEMRTAVRQIPGGAGWWHTRNEDTFMALADQLADQGIALDEVIQILSGAHDAVADEFGA